MLRTAGQMREDSVWKLEEMLRNVCGATPIFVFVSFDDGTYRTDIIG